MHGLWRSTTASLVAWNLLPLVGVLGLGWDPLVVLVLYWAELYVIVALNVAKILLAAGDRVGRRPDDVRLWQCGPPARLDNVWMAALSVLTYSLTLLLAAVASPVGDALGTVVRGEYDGLTTLTFALVVLSMVGSHFVAFRETFLGDGEYEVVTPGVQWARLFGSVWLLGLVFAVASGPPLVEGDLTALVGVLIVVKTVADVLAHRVLRVDSPETERYRRAEPPGEPKQTVQPALRRVLLAHAVVTAPLAIVIVTITVGVQAVWVFDPLGWPLAGVVVTTVALVGGTVGLWGVAHLGARRRYGAVEYRIYPDGVAIYNTRHQTLVRFVPYWNVEGCTVYRGVLGRLFGTGSVRLELRDGSGEGQLEMIERDTSGSDDEHELYLHALVDPEEIAAYIRRRTGVSGAIDPEASATSPGQTRR